jgi:acetyl-CoA acetyltransferase
MSAGGRGARESARQAVVVGIAALPYSKDIGMSEAKTGATACLRALADAGLSAACVDSLFRYTMQQTTEAEMARALGIANLRWFGSVDYGGGAGGPVIAHAALAVESGHADVAVVWRARNRKSGQRPWLVGGVGGAAHQEQFERPFGLVRPVDFMAILTRLWADRYGWKAEDLGRIAITIREHARRNPDAMMRAELSLDEYLNGRMIADPLRLHDCCLETDGALAMVVTTAERARDLDVTPVYVTASAMGTGPEVYAMSNWMADPIGRSPAWYVARDLWTTTDLEPADMDVVQFYDAFTPEVAISFEEYGFCGEGEAMHLLASGEHPPYNTSGGGLSEAYLHGMNLFVEAVRQVRGSSTDQAGVVQHALATSGNTVPCGAVIFSAGPR